MARVPVIISDTGEALVAVEVPPRDVIYQPSDAQRLLRAKFFQLHQDMPMGKLEDTSPSEIAQFTGDRRILTWWTKPLFKEWFLGKDEYVLTARLLAEKAQVILLEMLDDPDTPPLLRAKLALDIIKSFDSLSKNTQAAPRFLDAEVQNATPEQLRAFIEKQEK